MELSKEVYAGSPEKKDVQSVVKGLMEDEKIVGKKKSEKKSEKKEVEVSDEKVPEKKRRGRPPKKSVENKEKTDTECQEKVNDKIQKKPRGRPRKIKEVPPETNTQTHETQTHETQTHETQTHETHTDILPLIQSISSTHNLHTLPDKTLKYIIFLIHLSYHTPIPNLTTLIHTTITTSPHLTPHALLSTKHTLLSTSSAPVDNNP